MNESGVHPIEYKVLICPEKIEDTDPVLKAAREAGLELLDTHEREQMAQMRGTLIAIGGNAFSDWKGQRPEPGMKVLFGKYTGFNIEGKDKVKYRLCNDKDISAILS